MRDDAQGEKSCRQIQRGVGRRSTPPEPRVFGKFSSQACPRSRRAWALPRRRRSQDYTKGNARPPLVSGSTHAVEDVEGARYVSPDDYYLSEGVLRQPTEGVFSTILQDQVDRVDQACARIVLGASLAVRAGHFRAVGNEPLPVPFKDRRELVPHGRDGSIRWRGWQHSPHAHCLRSPSARPTA